MAQEQAVQPVPALAQPASAPALRLSRVRGLPQSFRAITCVSAGERHAIAVSADGQCWAWGDNSSGRVRFLCSHLSAIPVSRSTSSHSVASQLCSTQAAGPGREKERRSFSLERLASPPVSREGVRRTSRRDCGPGALRASQSPFRGGGCGRGVRGAAHARTDERGRAGCVGMESARVRCACGVSFSPPQPMRAVPPSAKCMRGSCAIDGRSGSQRLPHLPPFAHAGSAGAPLPQRRARRQQSAPSPRTACRESASFPSPLGRATALRCGRKQNTGHARTALCRARALSHARHRRLLCRAPHSAAPMAAHQVTSEGDLYVLGWGGSGQLGCGRDVRGTGGEAMLVEDPSLEARLSKSGLSPSLLTPGRSRRPEVPSRSSEAAFEPPFPKRRPACLVQGTAAAVACGSRHTAVLTRAGAVLCFGWNGHGQLGTGDALQRDEPAPALLPGAPDPCGGGGCHGTGWVRTLWFRDIEKRRSGSDSSIPTLAARLRCLLWPGEQLLRAAQSATTVCRLVPWGG